MINSPSVGSNVFLNTGSVVVGSEQREQSPSLRLPGLSFTHRRNELSLWVGVRRGHFRIQSPAWLGCRLRPCSPQTGLLASATARAPPTLGSGWRCGSEAGEATDPWHIWPPPCFACGCQSLAPQALGVNSTTPVSSTPPPTTATWDGGRRDWRGPLLVGPQGPVEPSVIHPTMGTLTRKDAPGPGSPRSSGPQRRGRWWSPFPWEDLEPSQSSFAWSAG